MSTGTPLVVSTNFFSFYISCVHCNFIQKICSIAQKILPPPLKGVCQEILDLQFFSWFEPTWAPDKQAKVFLNLVSRYSITKNGILHFFLKMIDVFTPKRISPDCPFKCNQRQVNISFRFWLRDVQFISAVFCTPLRLSPRCAAHHRDWLRSVLHTAEIVSAVCCTLRRYFRNFLNWNFDISSLKSCQICLSGKSVS